MESLFPYIREWFLQKEEYFKTFSNADSRVEGWFKAELLVLLERLVEQNHVKEYKREDLVLSPKDGKRKQVDFRLCLRDNNHFCELKALCISQAADTPRNLHFYFRDDQLGLFNDFKKLDELTSSNKWVLGFIYPSPDLADWNENLALLPTDLKHWHPVTKPQDFPEWLFISLWQG